LDVNIFSSLLKTSRMKTDWFFFVWTKIRKTFLAAVSNLSGSTIHA